MKKPELTKEGFGYRNKPEQWKRYVFVDGGIKRVGELLLDEVGIYHTTSGGMITSLQIFKNGWCISYEDSWTYSYSYGVIEIEGLLLTNIDYIKEMIFNGAELEDAIALFDL